MNLNNFMLVVKLEDARLYIGRALSAARHIGAEEVETELERIQEKLNVCVDSAVVIAEECD